MLHSSLKIFRLCFKKTLITPITSNYGMLATRWTAPFCKTEKHESNIHKPEDKQGKPKYHPNESQSHKEHETDKHHEEQEIHEKPHQHGPGCNHGHQHHEYNPKTSHHQHGPGCKHDHGHHHEPHKTPQGHREDHQAHHVKMSKLSFEELIELKTVDSMKYAHLIYQQESKRLREKEDEKEILQKNLNFFKKVEHEIEQKEKKLAQNIKIFEQQALLSKKRAQKQIEESKNFAVSKIAKELLEVADCVANCRKFAEQSEQPDQYILKVVESQQLIRNVLKKFEIEQFDPINQEYDPNLQESLLQVPAPPGFKPGQVAMTMRTGYTIKGRLLRSARVGVFS